MYESSEHKNSVETLKFVTFAYNTSLQKNTGRTPFFLIHDREAVQPIDEALGADPNEAYNAEGWIPETVRYRLASAQ